jgi:hypothetical protein
MSHPHRFTRTGMASQGVPELPVAAASPLPAEGSPPPSYTSSDRVKALKKVEPVDIQWERVCLRVPGKGGRHATKGVLTGISGQLRSGCITAIMVRFAITIGLGHFVV